MTDTKPNNTASGEMASLISQACPANIFADAVTRLAAHDADAARDITARYLAALLAQQAAHEAPGTTPSVSWPYFYTFNKPEGWINLANPGQSWQEWTSKQGIPTTKGWKVFGHTPTKAPTASQPATTAISSLIGKNDVYPYGIPPDATTASASGEVDWQNGLTQLLERYKHATDYGINSRESVQEQVIAYVLASRAPAQQTRQCVQPSREAAPQIKTWMHRLGPDYNDSREPSNHEVAMEAEIAELRAFIAQQGAKQAAPSWGAVHTVGDMVRNLLTLNQSDPIYAAFHVDYQGERRCRTRPVSISRERVIDGKWVDPARQDVPYVTIVWAKQDDRAEQAAHAGADEAYQELIYAVATKWPGETRHQTALRYIRERETPCARAPASEKGAAS